MALSIRHVLALTIGLSTLANACMITDNAPMFGIWGLVMQLVYSCILYRLPTIQIYSLPFFGLCSGLFIHDCLWTYYTPHPSAEQGALAIISVWMVPFLLMLQIDPSNNVVVEDDLECGVDSSIKSAQ